LLEIFIKIYFNKQTKTLIELNEDFRRSDFISLALLSSDILRVVVELLQHESADLRELVIKLLVYYSFKQK